MLISLEDIRLFINDLPEVNKLIDKAEFTPERIQKAINFTISEFNETPPIVGTYTEETFPYKATLLYGVLHHLFAGEAAFQERNHLPYQSGGLAVDDSSHSQAYLNLSTFFGAKYKELISTQKKVENIRNGWGIIRSRLYGNQRVF